MSSDSKKESYKAEIELCEILQIVVDKLRDIESSTVMTRYYEDVDSIDDGHYTDEGLPEYIHCNDGEFIFHTSWLDIDFKSYFEKLKEDAIKYKTITINNVEKSLNKHKEELEKLKNLTYENLEK